MLAFSCKNQFNELSNNSTSGYGTIYFVDSSRTVLETVEKDDFTKIILYAKKSDSLEAQKISEWKSYSDFVQSTVSVAIGTYDFYLEAFAGNVKFESDEIAAEIKENQKTNVNFVLHLVNRGEGNGNVKITYLFGDHNVATADFKLSKVEYVDDGKDGKIRRLDNVDVSFEGNDENSEGDWNIWGGPENPEQKNHCIFEKSIPAGQYELTARFESESGDYVAEYSTSVSVSEGITSSKEITIENFNPYYAISYTYPDDAEFIADYYPQIYSIYDEITFRPLDPKDTYNPFQGWYTEDNVKLEKISKYERTGDLILSAKWHLDSQYMLFSKVYHAESEQDVYTFAMTSDLSSNVESENVVNSKITDFTIGGGDFYYYISETSDGVFLRKTGDGSFRETISTDTNSSISNYIYWDYEFDKLYVLQIKLGGSTPNNNTIEKVLLYDPNSDEEPFVPFYIPNDDYSDSLIKKDNSTYDFAVNNNKLYIGYFNYTQGIRVSEFNIDFENKKIEYQNEILINETTSIGDINIILNDMICMNNNLYLLWNVSSGSGSVSNYYSYGNIYCMDEDSNVSSLANLNDKKSYSFSVEEQTYYSNYFGPASETDNTSLFGPTKFIAIKPKKLVVADEGVLIYEGDDEIIKMKNIDRVVELDLDINSITPTILHDITFNKESVEQLQIVCSYLYLNENGLKVGV